MVMSEGDVELGHGQIVCMTETQVAILQGLLEWATEQWNKGQLGLPSEWYQNMWCGTRCCIGGKAALNEGWKRVSRDTLFPRIPAYVSTYTHVEKDGQFRRVEDLACEILGFYYASPDQTMLFNGNNTLWDLWSIGQDVTQGRLHVPEGIPTDSFWE